MSNVKDPMGKFTVLTGRRRIGKTLLAQKYAENKESLYLFTSKKAEKLLCEEFLTEYENFTNEKYYGEINSFPVIFEKIVKDGCKKPFVLIIDEFQEFLNINKSIFSDLQRIWDEYKFQNTHTYNFYWLNIFSHEKNISGCKRTIIWPG